MRVMETLDFQSGKTRSRVRLTWGMSSYQETDVGDDDHRDTHTGFSFSHPDPAIFVNKGRGCHPGNTVRGHESSRSMFAVKHCAASNRLIKQTRMVYYIDV